MARAVSVCGPTEPLFQTALKGGLELCPTAIASTKNSTERTTPSVSVASADSAIGLPKWKLVPLVGEVIMTVGSVFVLLPAPGETPLANQLVGSLP